MHLLCVLHIINGSANSKDVKTKYFQKKEIIAWKFYDYLITLVTTSESLNMDHLLYNISSFILHKNCRIFCIWTINYNSNYTQVKLLNYHRKACEVSFGSFTVISSYNVLQLICLSLKSAHFVCEIKPFYVSNFSTFSKSIEEPNPLKITSLISLTFSGITNVSWSLQLLFVNYQTMQYHNEISI